MIMLKANMHIWTNRNVSPNPIIDHMAGQKPEKDEETIDFQEAIKRLSKPEK